MIPVITQELNEELKLTQHLLNQLRVEKSVFPFVVMKGAPSKVVNYQNYYKDKTNTLIHLFHDPIVRKKIKGSLEAVIDEKLKMHILQDCLSQPQSLLLDGKRLLGLMNINFLLETKRKFIHNSFFSLNHPSEYHNANYYLTLISVLEVQAKIDYFSEKETLYVSSLNIEDYITIATLILKKFIEYDGDKKASLVFDYFFISFTSLYNQNDQEFHSHRTKLIESLTHTMKAYSLAL
ncbi:hypothetical protein [Metabacillus malikii]|uniref:Uncharacterized protein n=1 Tax=Metabacillus malikii TaxID=1504265 RepID=A0ABT9Z9C9_9BACI|nr:hypothetical protein [Metabacillus malikii]MDQ0228864.1 hypothetical protein [Metabacillus malikii]